MKYILLGFLIVFVFSFSLCSVCRGGIGEYFDGYGGRFAYKMIMRLSTLKAVIPPDKAIEYNNECFNLLQICDGELKILNVVNEAAKKRKVTKKERQNLRHAARLFEKYLNVYLSDKSQWIYEYPRKLNIRR